MARPPKFSRPQIVARPRNLAVLLTHCGQLSLRKISKFDATRCQILRLKCTKFDFRWGSAPDPTGGAYSAPPALTVFEGPTFKGREREEGGKGKGRRRKQEGKGEGEGREEEGPAPPQYFGLEPRLDDGLTR